MQAGTILINGASLPYHVIDRAINWARENQAGLRVVFIFSDQANAESYVFPSDIEEMQTLVSEQEGEADIRRLLATNMEYIRKQCVLRDIVIEIIALKDPGSDELAVELQKGKVVFVDPKTMMGSDEYASTGFSFDDIIALSPRIIEVGRD